MAEFPALPLWTDAYLGDTTHLTTIEHGAYLLLLMAMWRTPTTSLPNDDKLLSRYARLTAGQWERIKPTLMPFFRIEGDRITQGRLTDEAYAVKRKSVRQSDKAKSRWLKNKEVGDAAAMPNACRTHASHTHIEEVVETNVSPTSSAPKVEKRKNGTRLPNDWTPLPGNVAFALAKGLPDARIDVEAIKFRNYWTSKAGKDAAKLDWSRTWENWVLRAVQETPTRTTAGGPHARHDESRNVLAACDELIASVRQSRGAGVRPDEGPPAAVLLPYGRRA